MKRGFSRRYLALVLLLSLGLLTMSSCLTSSPQLSSFYDAGASDFTPTGAQFAQYFLYHFDTGAAPHTLTLPSAVDIVSAGSSPYVGQVFIFSVVADGANSVTIAGGTGVTVKPSATTVAPNTTLLVYCDFTSVSAGSQAMTVY